MANAKHVVHSAEALDCLSGRFVEQLFREYSGRPERVSAEWRMLFANLDGQTAAAPAREEAATAPDNRTAAVQRQQEKVDRLVGALRYRGHLAAQIDPLALDSVQSAVASGSPGDQGQQELALDHYGLSPADLDRHFSIWPENGRGRETLRNLVRRLRTTYCRSIGYEFVHLADTTARRWLLERIERQPTPPELSAYWQERFLRQLLRADHLEQFTRTRYPGAKTFSLEGSEALIPLLDLALERAAEQGVEAIILGMAHRGRLNVLTNILGNRPRDIFRQFEPGEPQLYQGSGDVRYHLGDNGDWPAAGGQTVHLSLLFNPSHLEFVAPVAAGRVRARQDRTGDDRRQRTMLLLIHGDAAMSAEGIVYESLNLMNLAAYQVGGTLHVIINNQIGFTTSPEEGRSTSYASDVCRALDIPVFHVNGDDLEAVAWVTRLALDFRAEFSRDVVIDLVCFRRWGHNESDEPSLTQPQMYVAIEHHPSIRDQWVKQVLAQGTVGRDEIQKLDNEYRDFLRQEQEQAASSAQGAGGGQTLPATAALDRWEPLPRGIWDEFYGGPEAADETDTGVGQDRLQQLLLGFSQTPRGFHPHQKLQPAIARRRAMAEGREALDWSAAEALALASLAVEGHRVRLTGQDTARGTFSQRHAVLHDMVDGHTHNVFSQLDPRQAPVDVFNTPLCEAAALGFEYGYSLEAPRALVAWEAQFGDFANAAQVIIDQFLASAEDKWGQLSGVVLLLPHGFEGQGPEHSSARLERLLLLAAKDNLQIVQPSTPAQYFHVLRRQVTRRWRKPLVVLTPKSLLRHPRVRSPLADLAGGRFERVIGDGGVAAPSQILLCSGKVYYDLLAFREREKIDDVALIRVEQFYPLNDEHLAQALANCRPGTPARWVQEEPENMGAWRYWWVRYGPKLLGRFPLDVAARPESASPATGSKTAHKNEQQVLVQRAFGDRSPSREQQPASEKQDGN